jgi:hypothetical protein
MKPTRAQKGPWIHNLMVWFFSIVFIVLFYWLLGFIVGDISTWPGPDYQSVEKGMVDQGLLKELRTLDEQIQENNRSVASLKQRQSVLRDSTSNSEKTMNQLLELQKLTLQKSLTPSKEEAQALAESQRLFLANQAKYQEMNDQIALLNDQLGVVQNRQRAAQKILETERPAVQEEFNRLHSRHQFKLAASKLSILVPLLGLAVWLFFKQRGRLYAPLVYGFGLALLVKVGQVIHEHFPSRYFKYVLLVVSLLLVFRILIYLLRMTAFPKLDWLLKQYREAYEHFLCPVCEYPIRRGPLQHLFWTRRSLKRLRIPAMANPTPDEPYVCPVCATRLFEECPSCKSIRYSLLPACDHCGAEQPLQLPTDSPDPAVANSKG